MCEPVTIMMAASTALSAFGMVRAGQAAQAQGEYQMQVARNNKVMSDRLVADARKRGELEEARHRQKVQRLAASQRVAFAAGGLESSSGSPLDTIVGTFVEGETDALIIRQNAEREAIAHEFRGQNALAEGALAQTAGRSRAQASMVQAGSTLLSGAADAYGQWRGS
jgi:hypothetical protein